MKLFILTLSLIAFMQSDVFAQTEFDLDPSQSMLMTGKGPGQDGTINPYAGEDCYAVVTNMGKLPFSIRIQKKGEIIKTIPVKKGKVKKVKLLKGQELYLDSSDEGRTKAKVDYEQIKKG